MLISASAMLLTGIVLGIDQLAPVLGSWEHLQFFYYAGAVDPEISLRIGPRANLGGTGYPLLDVVLPFGGQLSDTLTGFRSLIYFYMLASLTLLISIFSRWFGFLPAFIGVVTMALSTGILFFASQFLILVPTFFLCVLMVELTTRMDSNLDALWLRLCLAAVVGLLLIHYSMGRFFAVGWLLFFFLQRVIVARKALGAGAAWTRECRRIASICAQVVACAAGMLYLFDPSNLATLANPVALFLPSKSEVAPITNDLTTTVFSNFRYIAEMLLPLPGGSADAGTLSLMAGQRTSLLNIWHTPLLISGMGVALWRTFVDNGTGRLIYLSIHALFVIAVGPSLLSLQTEQVATISPYRIFIGLMAVAGYMAVAAHWAIDLFDGKSLKTKRLLTAVTGAVWLYAGFSLFNQGQAARLQVEQLASFDVGTGHFVSPGRTLPYGLIPEHYHQARHRKLADLMSSALECRNPDAALLVRVSPRLLAGDEGFGRTGYIGGYNEFSATLAFYLRNAGTHAGHVIVHSAFDLGRQGFPNGYSGKRLKFSGPIAWRNGHITYVLNGPPQHHLLPANIIANNGVVIAFSEIEASLVRLAAKENEQHLSEVGPITTLKPLLAVENGRPALCASIDP